VATLLHGGISIFSPDGGKYHHVALGDRFVTNLCFGGRDMRTAYVTLSGSGQLIAIDGWPTAGLRLNYNA
jgi:gluconolactonase